VKGSEKRRGLGLQLLFFKKTVLKPVPTPVATLLFVALLDFLARSALGQQRIVAAEPLSPFFCVRAAGGFPPALAAGGHNANLCLLIGSHALLALGKTLSDLMIPRRRPKGAERFFCRKFGTNRAVSATKLRYISGIAPLLQCLVFYAERIGWGLGGGAGEKDGGGGKKEKKEEKGRGTAGAAGKKKKN